MLNMYRVRNVITIIAVMMLSYTNESIAKSYIYFTDGNNYSRIDAITNTVEQITMPVPDNTSNAGFLATDVVNKYLYIRHCQVAASCNIGVYDLITLAFIKEIYIGAQDYNMKMLLYPDATKFLIQYSLPSDELDPESDPGGYVTDLYDAKTQEEIKNIEEYISLEKSMFTKDGKKILSIIEGSEAKLLTYDILTFKNTEISDLTMLWRKKPVVFSSGIEGVDTGMLILFENIKSSKLLQDNLDIFVYDIELGTKSARISTGLQGNVRLYSYGNKLVLDENETLRYSGAVMGFISSGRLNFYDVIDGKKIGTFQLPVKGEGEILAIDQANNLLYYKSEGITKNSSVITIVDVKNFKTVTTLNIPFVVNNAIFYDR